MALTQQSVRYEYEPYPSLLDCCGGWFRTCLIVSVTLALGIAAGIVIDRRVLSANGFLQPTSPSDGNAQDEDNTPSSLGCYPAIREEDLGSDADVTDMNMFDQHCIEYPDEHHCRMGLPFFRRIMQTGQSMTDCASFCMSKMMDLSGISSSPSGQRFCRCGASENDILIWGDDAARPNLLLPTHLRNSEGCSMVIYKTPKNNNMDFLAAHMEMNDKESRYVAAVRMGMNRGYLHEDEHSTDYTGPEQPNSGQANDENYRACFPYACASGGVWTNKVDGIVTINYYFDTGLGTAAKSTFREAIESYETKTCIRFRESSSRPTVKVHSSNPSSCSATVGYPGMWGEGNLNMGWCNTMTSVGNVVHELGHIIGRTHTQRRPDATRQYKGKGPYLKINWQNVPSNWKSQYSPSSSAYIGSNYQGAGDPFEGHADYDYTSIMSYGPGGVGAGARMEALNPAYQWSMGQRNGMSAADVLTVKDMYQCGRSAAAPAANLCLGVFIAALVAAMLH